jgi:hypothetical protein
MAKEQDQSQTTEEEKTVEQLAEEAALNEEEIAIATATKTSEEFDKRLDEDGVADETPSDSKDKGGDDKGSAAKKDDATEKDDSKAEGDDKDSAPTKEEDGKVDVKDDGKSTELKIDKALAQRGRDIGLLDEEMSAYSSEKDLEQTINIVESIARESAEQDSTAQQTAQKPDKTSDTKKDDDGEAEKGFKLEFKDEAEIDPEILKNMKGMQSHYEGLLKKSQEEVKALRGQVEGTVGKINQEETTRFMGRFDGMVKELGQDFADTFGEGATDDLSKRSSAHKNRSAVLGRMYAFANGLSEAGQTIPDEQQLFEIAVNSLHGQKMKNTSGARMKKKTDERSKQALGRAATRRTGSLTPDQKALETSKKFDNLIDTTED